MDDGHYCYSNDTLGLTFGLESLEITPTELERFFIDRFGLIVKLIRYKTCHRVIFSAIEGKKFISLVRKFIHPSLYYKLGEDKLKMDKAKSKASMTRKIYWERNKQRLNILQRNDYKKRKEYHSLRKKKDRGKILSTCSNCGHINDYFKTEWKGREKTICKKCKHVLSICYFINY